MNQNDNQLPILHIGYPKTATKWFQKMFFPYIPDIEFFDAKRINKIFTNDWRNIQQIEKMRDVFRTINKRIIISDESMIGGLNYFEQNAHNFKEIFYPAQIIIFIRNQLDVHVSAYSQYIKSGGTYKFENFLFPTAKEIRAGKKHNYASIISLYKKLFGENNVFVYLFEDFCKDHLHFMQQFCSNHNLDIDFNKINFKRKNIILSAKLLKIKRLFNYFTKYQPYRKNITNSPPSKYLINIPYWFEFSYIIFEQINKLFPKSKRPIISDFLNNKQINILKDYYSNSNNKLITDHGISRIREYNYPI